MKLVTSFLALFFSLVCEVFTFKLLFDWFVSPAFGLVPIDISYVLGLILFKDFLLSKLFIELTEHNPLEKKDSNRRVKNGIAYLAFLFTGYLIYLV